MFRRVWLLTSLFLVFSFLFFYKFSSLDCYLKAKKFISEMNTDMRIKAEREFYGDPEKGLYSGILAGVWKGKKNGVLLWTKSGLKLFVVGNKTVYSYFNGCTDDGKFIFSNLNGSVKIDRDFIFNIDDFIKTKRRCDFLTIRLDVSNDEDNSVWEIWARDWWLFKGTSMQDQCKK